MCNVFGCLTSSIRITKNKVVAFWEDVTPNMEDDEFRRFFRMNKETLRSLTNFLNPARRSYQGGRQQIGPAKMVAVALLFLGSQCPCKQLSNMLGMTESCFVTVTEYILQILTEKSSHVIKWPSKEQYTSISNEFNKRRIRLT